MLANCGCQMRALNLIRKDIHYRRDAFDAGLRAAGFTLVDKITDPTPDDVLLIWNKYGGYYEHAMRFAAHGAKIIVAENCPLGNDWRGGKWYSLALDDIAMVGGQWPAGNTLRWDQWKVDLDEWQEGDEIIILGQRGIGSPDAMCPLDWAQRIQMQHGFRIRPHPGTSKLIPLKEGVPFTDDLKRAGAVVTWGSSAAIRALVMGIPVYYSAPGFAGALCSTPIEEYPKPPMRDHAARLQMFRRLAWAMWNLEEIASGEPIKRLL